MKQILQNLKTGETEIVDVPCPKNSSGNVLIRSSRSVISAGTERMLIDFGKANMLDKARQQPDKVRMVLDKMKTDGIRPTVEAVFNKLNQALPLGYCNMGTVIFVGDQVSGFSKGDRVISNGNHSEIVSVPKNLCAHVPDNVSDEHAAFTVLGAIALQGIRLVKPTLGETIVVTGLGIIGLLTVQLLRANGCQVIGIDFDKEKLDLAARFGAKTVNLGAGEDPVKAANLYTNGQGVDAVLITAATKSNEPVRQGAEMCRKRGRIVLVGVTGLELSRADFFEKELSFQVSCSYGPGRYDANYEIKGQDYPLGFVRWTEQRNFKAVLAMMSDGSLDIDTLVSHRFGFSDARKAYSLISDNEPVLGVVLEYPEPAHKADEELLAKTIALKPVSSKPNASVFGFIGSGSYASSVLVPAFKAQNIRLKTTASIGGISGVHVGKKFGFENTTTDLTSILEDDEITAVVISTRHDSHANLVCKALLANKHVFVEKPLALTFDEIGDIEKLLVTTENNDTTPVLTVGFNRRFAPQIEKIQSLLKAQKGPKSFIMTVNAGAIPADHWTQDRSIGGGRIIGEACHFIDLLRFLAGAVIVESSVVVLDASIGDTVTISLKFKNGSIGTIHYFANGNKKFPKERLEIFSNGGILQLDNFRKLKGYAWPGFSKMNLRNQDKGQKNCAAAFVAALKNGTPPPIPLTELLEVSKIAIELDGKINAGIKQ